MKQMALQHMKHMKSVLYADFIVCTGSIRQRMEEDEEETVFSCRPTGGKNFLAVPHRLTCPFELAV